MRAKAKQMAEVCSSSSAFNAQGRKNLQPMPPPSTKRWFYIWSDICCVGCKSSVVDLSSRSSKSSRSARPSSLVDLSVRPSSSTDPFTETNPLSRSSQSSVDLNRKYVQLSCLHFLHVQCATDFMQDGTCAICWRDVSQEVNDLKLYCLSGQPNLKRNRNVIVSSDASDAVSNETSDVSKYFR